MTAPKVMIGIPCYTGNIAAETATGLVCAASSHLFTTIDWMVGCCHIGIARDCIAHHFMEDDAVDKLLFIDTDMVFEPAHIQRITSHNLPIVAGLYKGRSDTGKEAISPWKAGEETVTSALLNVRRAGTGFMCISKQALRTIMERFPDRWYTNDSGEKRFHFFPAQFAMDAAVNHMVVQTDDFGFCDLATAAGLSIHVDLAVNLGHKGHKIFRVQFAKPDPSALAPKNGGSGLAETGQIPKPAILTPEEAQRALNGLNLHQPSAINPQPIQ